MALRIGAALSLTGRFARFGAQAASGLRIWRELGGAAEIDILDDRSAAARVGPALDELAGRCDLLLGPYGTPTARAAARWAREHDRLVWNHGGAASDVQAAAPGRLVSLMTPTDRSGEPFVRHLAEQRPGTGLRLVAGPGTFGPLVVDGMRRAATRLGVPLTDEGAALFSAGTFEHDTEFVAGVLTSDDRPDVLGAVAAGVWAFTDAVAEPEGILGVAQWTAGAGTTVDMGPDEDHFRARYRSATGTEPDYPAVQAAAAATIAVHCADAAGTGSDALWRAACELRTTTLYGAFGIDPVTGAQEDHRSVLTRWRGGILGPVRA